MLKKFVFLVPFLVVYFTVQAQITRDSVKLPQIARPTIVQDTSLRIINLNPFFSLHVDSSLSYQLLINKPIKNYYWYLKDAPTGLRIDKDNGTLSFKSNKSLFMSGRLKYDKKYPVQIGVQNLSNPYDRIDTAFIISFYNTDVIYPRVKPTVVSPVIIEEGYKFSFNILCDNGNFPIDRILFSSNITLPNVKLPKQCDDPFEWTPPYDFVSDRDSAKVKVINMYFIGTTQYNFADTAKLRVIVKDALNYDIANNEYNQITKEVNIWVLQLKYTFLQLDKKIRKNKNARSTFDITTATTTVTGTIVSTTSKDSDLGKILPSVGIVALPVKEAAAPNKSVEQNQAALVRSTIKRLEYVMSDNRITGERDESVAVKTETLRKELRQSQIQLAEVPTEISKDLSEKQLNDYFDSPKVQRKYRLK